MTEVLGFKFSASDVVDNEKYSKLVVKQWNDGSITLCPEFSDDQMFYSSLASTENYEYRFYEKSDFQEMADDFNNEISDNEWNQNRLLAIREEIGYSKELIVKYQEELEKYQEMLKSLNVIVNAEQD